MVEKVNIGKTLCKQCDECDEYAYQRTISHGKRKGQLFKFNYCKGNVDIIKIGNWGPDTSTLKDGSKKVYVCSTKRFDGKARHFEYFLKKHPSNVVLHLGDTLDLRMRKLREVSCRCKSQTRTGTESIFPGVGLTSAYKANPRRNKDKKRYWARVKINGKDKYLDNFYTELEAAHAYYSFLEENNLDVNKETAAYKIYQRWLNVKKYTDKIITEILTDYKTSDKAELEWYYDLIRNKLRDEVKKENK